VYSLDCSEYFGIRVHNRYKFILPELVKQAREAVDAGAPPSGALNYDPEDYQHRPMWNLNVPRAIPRIRVPSEMLKDLRLSNIVSRLSNMRRGS